MELNNMANKIFIPIHSKTYGTHVITINYEDRYLFDLFTWRIHKTPQTCYVRTNIKIATNKQKVLLLHQAIIGIPLEGVIDHKDGSGLNNSRGNLRYASFSDNSRNCKAKRQSGLKGAYWDQQKGKYRARIQVNNKNLSLGYYITEKEAHDAYMVAALKYFGEFAKDK